jgi:hypothetical protein
MPLQTTRSTRHPRSSTSPPSTIRLTMSSMRILTSLSGGVIHYHFPSPPFLVIYPGNDTFTHQDSARHARPYANWAQMAGRYHYAS